MKTLLIGDTHLMCRLILPSLDKIIEEQNVKRLILMGDYTDQWGAIGCPDMYKNDLRFLYWWKSEMTARGVLVVLLTGNHGIPYLIGEPMYYSVMSPYAFDWIKEMLYDLGLQIAYRLEDYLVSHAGFTKDYEPLTWHFEVLTVDHKDRLAWLHNHAGLSRGGRYVTGSPVWADLNGDMLEFYHQDYPKQIVGHTPITSIDLTDNIIGVDTFSLSRSHVPLGNGEMFLYEDGRLSVIEHPIWNDDVVGKYFDENLQIISKTESKRL